MPRPFCPSSSHMLRFFSSFLSPCRALLKTVRGTCQDGQYLRSANPELSFSHKTVASLTAHFFLSSVSPFPLLLGSSIFLLVIYPSSFLPLLSKICIPVIIFVEPNFPGYFVILPTSGLALILSSLDSPLSSRFLIGLLPPLPS